MRPVNRSGQAMVFGALTLFCLISFAAAAFNVGQVSSRRIQVQSAADQAALAGAQVEADLLSEIAWINDGMAYVYYNLMRYAVDVSTYAVLAELKQHGPPYPSDDLVGLADPVGAYDEAYAQGQAWITRGQAWIDHLEKLEDGIAVAAPGLIRQEVFRVALAHGAEKVAIYPDLLFYPDPDSLFLLMIERLSNGWRLTDNSGYLVQVTVLGPDSYQVTSSTGGSFTVVRNSPDQYTVTTESGEIVLTQTDLGWVVSGPGGSFSVAPGPNGGTLITGEGSSGEFRRDTNGNLQQFVDGQWTALGSQTIMIDGVEVPINQGSITVGGARIDLEPLTIWIDNIRIIPTADDILIDGQIGPAHIRVQDDYAVVNDLSTQSADGKWRPWGGDRTRHRMTQTGSDLWEYELVKEGSVLQVEPNRERGAVVHAVRENDPGYLAGNGYPAWMADPTNPSGWFDPRTGRSKGGQAYHQTRLCWGCGGRGTLGDDPPATCPTCEGIDHDGDTLTDVRKYQEDTLTEGNPTWRDPPFQSVVLPIPYVLGETFFRYGINVGTWKDKSKSLLGFTEPDWGTFAFASARAGILDRTTGLFKYGIADLVARDDWLANDQSNLYEPEWEARLVSTRTAIRSDDIDADVAVDSGTAFLLRGFLDTAWLETADDRNPAWWVNGKLRNMRSKEGKRFDPLDRAVEDVVRH